MSSEGPSKILTPEEAYCPTTAANAVAAAQIFEIAPWLCTYLLRKGFAVEPLDDRDCVAQGTDQTLRGRRRNYLKVSCDCCNLSMTNKSQTSTTGRLAATAEPACANTSHCVTQNAETALFCPDSQLQHCE
jgi:hypothetical protein